MAANGYYSNSLMGCHIPKCLACLFGKLTCCPWQTKSQSMGAMKLCTYSGQYVLVDQLESPTLGLILAIYTGLYFLESISEGGKYKNKELGEPIKKKVEGGSARKLL